MKELVNDGFAKVVKPYIDAQDKKSREIIAPVEVSPAEAAHSIGEQIIFDGILYDVIEAIEIDDPLSTTGAGANIEPADNIYEQIEAQKAEIQTVRAQAAANNKSTQEMIAPVEEDETDASRAYEIGEQLILDGILYDVIDDIAQHGIITAEGAGANIEAADTIAEQIENLSNEVDANTQAINGLATVASTGSYDDLSNKPSIPAAQVSSDWNASSGVAQILNKPTLGTAASKNSTTAVTSESADLVTSGAVYTDSANKHKLTIKTVTTSGWTSDTTSQSGTTLYKKSISLNHVYVESPAVDIATSSGTGLPTAAQQTAYDLLQYVTVDGTTLYLYASAIPTTQFYIGVEGVD